MTITASAAQPELPPERQWRRPERQWHRPEQQWRQPEQERRRPEQERRQREQRRRQPERPQEQRLPACCNPSARRPRSKRRVQRSISCTGTPKISSGKRDQTNVCYAIHIAARDFSQSPKYLKQLQKSVPVRRQHYMAWRFDSIAASPNHPIAALHQQLARALRPVEFGHECTCH
jgi:hypothetical protein